MSKYLTIICEVCGKTHIFRGNDILEQIDASDWQENPTTLNNYPKGQIGGWCSEECSEAD